MIVGWRETLRELAMLLLYCRLCGVQGWMRIYRKIDWFTVFFLPIVPLAVSRFALCGSCGLRNKLSKAEAEALLAQAP